MAHLYTLQIHYFKGHFARERAFHAAEQRFNVSCHCTSDAFAIYYVHTHA